MYQRSLIIEPSVAWELNRYSYIPDKGCEIVYKTKSSTIIPTIEFIKISYSFDRGTILIGMKFTNEIPLNNTPAHVVNRKYNPREDKTIQEIKVLLMSKVDELAGQDCSKNIDGNKGYLLYYEIKIDDRIKLKAILKVIDYVVPFHGYVQDDIFYLASHEPRSAIVYVLSYADQNGDHAIEIAENCGQMLELANYYVNKEKYYHALECFKLYVRHGKGFRSEFYKDSAKNAKYMMGLIKLLEYMENPEYGQESLKKSLKYFVDSEYQPMVEEVSKQFFNGVGLFSAPGLMAHQVDEAFAAESGHKMK